MTQLKVTSGKPMPFGATLTKDGINFCIFSRNGTSVMLDLFTRQDDAQPYFSYTFNPFTNKTGDAWHCEIHGIKAGTLYLYRVDGPFDLNEGHRFNKNQYLLDLDFRFKNGTFLKAGKVLLTLAFGLTNSPEELIGDSELILHEIRIDMPYIFAYNFVL